MPEPTPSAGAIPSPEADIRAALGTRLVVLVGMMGAGKSTIGRRLAARLHVPFLDADIEIEAAAGMTIPEIFETHGEPHFRDGEARVIARLLESGPAVLATGGGSFMREETRRRVNDKAISIWLKADADIIMRRVKRRAARENRRGMYRSPAWQAVRRGGAAGGRGRDHGRPKMTAPLKHSDPITVDVALGARAYDIVIGRDVLGSLGARVAALRPGARTAIVTDRNVAKHWLDKTEASLAEAGIATSRIIVEEGEGSKTYAGLEQVSEALIAARIERNDLVIALGGGVVGDLAGFAAAILRRGV